MLKSFNRPNLFFIHYLSLSPSHLDTRSDEDTDIKVELFASVATALARYDFPVPGGCKKVLFHISQPCLTLTVNSQYPMVFVFTGFNISEIFNVKRNNIIFNSLMGLCNE